jgi:predicted 3-demethylubiquinone-9 3-methyltransferase (glyoxalase superfamily)
MPITITPFLWFDNQAAEAHAFYTQVFYPSDGGSETLAAANQGPFMGSVSLPGMELMLFDGGPHVSFNDAISLFVSVETQEEVDRLWDALSEGGAPGRCGWLTDRFGVRWQIVPTALGELMSSGDHQRSMAVREAMMTMDKFDIAALREAYER